MEVQSPAQRVEIIAALACLVCLAYLFSVGQAALESVPFWWAKMSAYTLIPLTLTFTILHGGCIHREMTKTVRVLFLLLNSLLIFVGAGLAMGAIAALFFVFMPLSRFHY